jgi:Flp pilus assembly protein TadG
MNRPAPRSLRRDRRGGTAIEFAATALVMLVITIGMVELGVVLWSWQALQGAAFVAARCASLNAASCKNAGTSPAATQSYAAAQAQTRGLTSVTSANVTVATGTGLAACGSATANMVSVTLTYPISAAYLVTLPANISASACFPFVNN